MKRKLIAIALAALTLVGCAEPNTTSEAYRMEYGVVEGDAIITDNGHIWDAEGNCTGDVIVVFDTKGTNDVTDDDIILVSECK